MVIVNPQRQRQHQEDEEEEEEQRRRRGGGSQGRGDDLISLQRFLAAQANQGRSEDSRAKAVKLTQASQK
jgi:hypothetical protein